MYRNSADSLQQNHRSLTRANIDVLLQPRVEDEVDFAQSIQFDDSPEVVETSG